MSLGLGRVGARSMAWEIGITTRFSTGYIRLQAGGPHRYDRTEGKTARSKNEMRSTANVEKQVKVVGR